MTSTHILKRILLTKPPSLPIRSKLLRRMQATITQAQKKPKAAPIPRKSRKKEAPEPAAKTPKAVLLPEKSLQLRSYQEECIQAVLDHVRLGHRRLGISLATGSGKTVIFTKLIERLDSGKDSEATQTLILVHRRELVEQALKHCIRAYPHKVIEVEMANKHSSGLADITIASIASIISKDRIAKFDPAKFKLILIDECHHAVASSYLQTLDHFGALHPAKTVGQHPVVVGVSATLSRHDGLKLGAIIDYIVYHKDYVDMIKDSWLSNVIFTTVQTHVDLSSVRLTGVNGDFNTTDLAAVINTDQTNEVTVRSWLDRAGKRKSTLVFCVDISHVVAITNKFRSFGVDARFITSLTSKEDRSDLLDEFKAGKYPVLVNCGIFTEGTDIPNIDCVLLARPTRSKNLLVQMIGRGMRLSPGKIDCHVIDMVGVINKGIVTTPTLFGLDPFAIIEEASPDEMEEMLTEEKAKAEYLEISPNLPDEQVNKAKLEIKKITYTHYESIYDLLSDSRNESFIRQLSPYAWVKVGPDSHVLSAMNIVLRIDLVEDGTYILTETKRPKFNLFLQHHSSTKPRLVIEGVDDFEHIVKGADSYAAENLPRELILHSAKWRKSPATDPQLDRLCKIQPDAGWRDRLLTKGKAMDILTRLKHGRSSWEKIMKQVQRAKKAEEKEEELKRSMEVRVGRVRH